MTKPNRRTYIRRLRNLRELLLNIKEELPELGVFDMGTFYIPKNNARFFPSRPHRLHPCGSAACALGAAALHPRFKRQGLKLGGKGGKGYFGEPVPTYNGEKGFRAGAEFFGLQYGDAEDLFTEGRNNRTPKQVAANILRMMKRKFGVDADGKAIAR